MVESANESSNTPLFDFHKKILQALAKYAKIWFEKKTIFLKKKYFFEFFFKIFLKIYSIITERLLSDLDANTLDFLHFA